MPFLLDFQVFSQELLFEYCNSESMSVAITLAQKAERATIVALSIPFIVPVAKATLFLKFNILN